jgi:hypothetical protein
MSDRQIQIDGLHVPTESRAVPESGGKRLDVPDLNFPLLKVDLEVVVVDIDQVKQTLEVELGLSVQARFPLPVLDWRLRVSL